jgi:hypothetical protein
MSKQTAMQEMYDELIAHEYIIPLTLIVKCKELIEIEREQIQHAYFVGSANQMNDEGSVEQYLNETYGPSLNKISWTKQ